VGTKKEVGLKSLRQKEEKDQISHSSSVSSVFLSLKHKNTEKIELLKNTPPIVEELAFIENLSFSVHSLEQSQKKCFFFLRDLKWAIPSANNNSLKNRLPHDPK